MNFIVNISIICPERPLWSPDSRYLVYVTATAVLSSALADVKPVEMAGRPRWWMKEHWPVVVELDRSNR